ncbi:putative smooth [Danaus plexippus plexippus]|uniref:Smooth n=1 Tax=Danaus plexippus plexippus TaxID=278856 RepID=A0A212F567_DANPL|nr:putative smooth [Danaus plexippus plexippus]
MEKYMECSNGNNYMSGEPRRKRELPARPNHILLYTIINPAYPITVLNKVTSRVQPKTRSAESLNASNISFQHS